MGQLVQTKGGPVAVKSDEVPSQYLKMQGAKS